MALSPGGMLSHYRLVEKIGEGGMGVVWKADDTILGRHVAIKVLPPDFAQDAEQLARFRQEARLLASLNHPNIAAIHGLEESDGVRYLVLELVPGLTLAERIARGPLPVDEALTVCCQITEALEEAHEKGVIHRDLKPGNVMVTPDGKVKVLDFGLAKAFEEHPVGADLTQSPTLTSPPTRAGVLLGTAPYMSPEQVRGKPLDKRTDIWAFGCVLREMLTGQRTFGGDTVTDTLAAVLKMEPDWDALPPETPWRIRDVLRRCLKKDVRARLRDIGEARIAIQAVLSGTPEDEGESLPGTAAAVPRPVRPGWPERALWVVGLAVALLMAYVGWSRIPAQNTTTLVSRFTINLPDSAPVSFIGAATLGNGRRAFTISRDGTLLVYAGMRDGVARLYLRSLDSYDTEALPGTEGAYGPFFSPDGQWIGFFVGNELKKVRVAGGAPVLVAEATNSVGADWGTDHRIVFAAQEGLRLLRVSDEGGTPEVLSEDPELYYLWPQILPGAKAILLSGESNPFVLELETGQTRRLPVTGTDARYAGAYLLFSQGSVLFAARFDSEQRNIAGPSVPILSGLRSEIYGRSQWDVSGDGTLVYATGQSVAENSLVWVSRSGEKERLSLPTRRRGTFEASPDGTRLAVIEKSGASSDLWIYDMKGLHPQQLTMNGNNSGPIFWSTDGKRIVFHKIQPGSRAPYMQSIDAGGIADPLLSPGKNLELQSWSGDGRLLGANDYGSDSQEGILVIDRTTGERHSIPTAGGDPWGTAISPGGRAVAYTSDETGEYHIYAQPFPPTGLRKQVSRVGGSEEPRWSRDGTHLFYRSGQRIMEVKIKTTPQLSVEAPTVFFQGDFVNVGGRSYDVAPDMGRVLIIEGGAGGTNTLKVVQGWFAELQRLVPDR